jgi:hypothetical protein
MQHIREIHSIGTTPANVDQVYIYVDMNITPRARLTAEPSRCGLDGASAAQLLLLQSLMTNLQAPSR